MAQKYGRTDLNPIKSSAAEKSLRERLCFITGNRGAEYYSDG